jgi:hypothetical protein
LCMIHLVPVKRDPYTPYQKRPILSIGDEVSYHQIM